MGDRRMHSVGRFIPYRGAPPELRGPGLPPQQRQLIDDIVALLEPNYDGFCLFWAALGVCIRLEHYEQALAAHSVPRVFVRCDDPVLVAALTKVNKCALTLQEAHEATPGRRHRVMREGAPLRRSTTVKP